MKVETPQILWHNGSEGNGKPAPLYSVSLLPSSSSSASEGDILATAGNTNEVHIWKITFPIVQAHPSSPSTGQQNKRQKILSGSSSNISLTTTITRHQRSVNTVAFSPLGTHLATAGDGGSLIIHTIPASYRRSEEAINQFWKKQLSSEKDLNIKVLNTHAEDIMDLSWSSDEKRVILGSLDHSVFVFEDQQQCSTSNQVASTSNAKIVDNPSLDYVNASVRQSQWNCVWRNTKEHTHYVQGVAYDPLGVYLASQGSDRSVRVWQRKINGKTKGTGKKKVLAVMDDNVDEKENTTSSLDNAHVVTSANRTSVASNDVLMGKFEVGKAKMLKYRNSNSTTNSENNSNDGNAKPAPVTNNNTATATSKKRYLFADESSVESFFRRLAWTKDGSFLITPASLWHSNAETQDASPSSPSFATYLFARHQYDRPFKVLSGLEKPSVVIRPNPVLFLLPKDVASDLKENMKQKSSVLSNDLVENIPYRSIFAVLTVDSILIYDTHHSRPLCIARGLHYAGLTDCTWSSDGRNLIVCSTDGYISILSFAEGELGDVYLDCASSTLSSQANSTNDAKDVFTTCPKKNVAQSPSSSALPPCEPGQGATLAAPPSKRARIDKREKKRVVPTLLSTSEHEQQPNEDINTSNVEMGHGNAMETEVVGAVTNLSINNGIQSKVNQIQSIC